MLIRTVRVKTVQIFELPLNRDTYQPVGAYNKNTGVIIISMGSLCLG